MIRASRLTARPLTARKLIAYKLGQGPVSGFDPIKLFSAGEEGTWLDFISPQVYADTAGTDPAEVGEGIALTLDKSQGAELGPELVTNGTFDTDTDWTKGAGWTISGGAAAFNAGTGAELIQSGYSLAANTLYQIEFDMVQVSGGGLRIVVDTSGSFVSQYFTSTARHKLVFSVSASSSRLRLAALGGANFSIDNISVRELKGVHALQATSTARPILRLTSGVYHAEFDLTDDILPITLPTITGGTVSLVGLNGIWIEDDWDFTAGTLNIGPTTIAGLPAGILSVVGDLCAVIINDRAWTAAERAGVIAWGKARGAPGVFAVSDTELVTNGDFSDGDTGWTTAASWSISGGELVVTQTGSVVGCSQTFAVTTGDRYFVEMECTSYTSGVCSIGTKTGLPQEAFKLAAASVGRGVITAGAANDGIRIVSTGAGFFGSLDNISVRKLELIP